MQSIMKVFFVAVFGLFSSAAWAGDEFYAVEVAETDEEEGGYDLGGEFDESAEDASVGSEPEAIVTPEPESEITDDSGY